MEGSKTFDRSLCARLGYLDQDLPVTRHCFRRSAAFMAKPCNEGWNRLKRAASFLKSYVRRKLSVDSDRAEGPLTH